MAIDRVVDHVRPGDLNDEATTPSPSTWRHALCRLLVAGSPVDQAVTRLAASGVPEEDVRAEAHALTTHPLFAHARTASVRLRSRDWMLSVYATLAALGSGGSHAPVRRDLSRDDFISEFYLRNQAVLLEGAARAWPALTRWNASYLKETCGDVVVEVMFNRDSASVAELNTAKRLARSMRWAEYVDLVYSGARTNNYYIVARNNFFDDERMRRLLGDLGPLPYVRTDYVDDNVKMWFGPAGTLTPLHCDDRNNVIVQILGRKVVRLYAPYYAEMMAQNSLWYAGTDPAESPDANAQRAIETRLELGPGDALFIPAGWWHAIEAQDVSITLALLEFGIQNRFGASPPRRGLH